MRCLCTQCSQFIFAISSAQMSSQIGDDMKNTKYQISLGVDYTVVLSKPRNIRWNYKNYRLCLTVLTKVGTERSGILILPTDWFTTVDFSYHWIFRIGILCCLHSERYHFCINSRETVFKILHHLLLMKWKLTIFDDWHHHIIRLPLARRVFIGKNGV